ncbi:MAG: diaminopimelate decarboxylase [Oscillospiraceae bacterium]|nr:diaminopimelate decarboxylase [Oscillospiraceae bacterium]
MICSNVKIKDGVLYFGGQNTVLLAEKYGTPLYLMDEATIRENCRNYVSALQEYMGQDSYPLYASKAASFKRIYEIIGEEGLGADVVSSGEIYTALKAGFDMSKAYFQGNNKTDEDIVYAMDNGVGYFVCDNVEEVDAIERIACEKGIVQKILLRLTPGIDPHTYDEVATGKVDSKFGTAIETGQALEIALHTLECRHISLEGFHCHVGSMVFESSTFTRSAEIMLGFMHELKNNCGFVAKILDLGGGYGVKYTCCDPAIDIKENIKGVCEFVKAECQRLDYPLPSLRLEPGRSIAANAGMTLYTVGTVKRITGYKNYVSVDGGMTDNPRFALYGSKYTVLLANKASEETTIECDLVGRCCESGDVIQPNVKFPNSVTRGDIVAVLTTGAYNYSMASNYNRICRPPVVMIDGERDYVSVKRESFEYLTANDV